MPRCLLASSLIAHQGFGDNVLAKGVPLPEPLAMYRESFVVQEAQCKAGWACRSARLKALEIVTKKVRVGQRRSRLT
jgi:hypothetical protein